ncbi:Rhodanese-like domain-containing protein 10 [Apostasia shenzhenica]|uniref:Rhodanese-like domain-containing protein 10 n=1 Tax=Apostasia shenzhenica TaxID=1088818 RepID=A0A2I0B4F7_9ASPA|nr:Rhodanese-like domain-containing protein 10 [Apostasia shenzhenica]
MSLRCAGLAQLSPLRPSLLIAPRSQDRLDQQNPTASSSPIRAIPPKDAAAALRPAGGYRLLDVRPPWERERAWIRGSLHVPLYVEDTQVDPVTLLKKSVHFGYIGLWTGQRFTALNPSFVSEVKRLVPRKDKKLLVACGEGLRSLAAVKKLREEGGYGDLAWLAGGFNRSGEDDFGDVERGTKLQYAAVGESFNSHFPAEGE